MTDDETNFPPPNWAPLVKIKFDEKTDSLIIEAEADNHGLAFAVTTHAFANDSIKAMRDIACSFDYLKKHLWVSIHNTKKQEQYAPLFRALGN